MTIYNGLPGRRSLNNRSLSLAGCFLVTSWLSCRCELYPWHFVVHNPSVLSPLQCGWSSVSKALPFPSPTPFSVGLETVIIFLQPLFVCTPPPQQKKEKRKKNNSKRKGSQWSKFCRSTRPWSGTGSRTNATNQQLLPIGWVSSTLGWKEMWQEAISG